MTKDEATAVVAVVRSGAIPQEFAPQILERWEDILLPLPFEYCIRAARRWMLSVPVDQHGAPVPKFLSEPSAILTAVGVAIEARGLVEQALRDGGEVHPSLRGSGRSGPWEYVEPGAPLPRGVGEYYVNAGLSLPPDRCVEPALQRRAPAAELPPPTPISEEQRQLNLKRLAGLTRELGAKKAAS